ncbi:hypothetical protein ymoll0001_38380 [Yersinia mollaretii ATCC 43969]|uniref:Uncharacterized protein n=1 Tax=Yersinia mollaretii (strain ATCC 43969 / DSM 18520 / CIP 103324 / CNY 7263 / WAIP 204) TaxID=349967 RepID=A0ABM9Y798_YERMW|nr:hypothetical protein ymoll0001_38380 [Yersinia mollaretii ATCC 43969]
MSWHQSVIRVSEYSQHSCSIKNERYYPKSLASQLGGKRMSPDELTQVSDSGE